MDINPSAALSLEGGLEDTLTVRKLREQLRQTSAGGSGDLIKEANNHAGLAAHLSQRCATHCVHFQLVMLAYNLLN